MEVLESLKNRYKKIVNEELGSDQNIVFGEGNIEAEVVLIGEAPGEKEEETGRSFVGTAGKNLDEFLEIVKLSREDIYITNVVKVRPYKVNPKTARKSNRPPTKKEMGISIGILREQLEFIKPKVVVTLGNVPLKALLGDDNAKIGTYHGKPIDISKFVLFPLYHPASIIYNRSLYDTYIEDVNKLKAYLDKGHIGGM
ncbi:MAG: uracil-DNA glycosylase [Clostridiales bacterium]|nr:uracil-DNA glycosylase [Clostridiales bacterium]